VPFNIKIKFWKDEPFNCGGISEKEIFKKIKESKVIIPIITNPSLWP